MPEDHGRTVKEKGLEYWARATMKNRLGDVPDEMFEWWVKLFCSSSPRVLSEIQAYVYTVDLTDLLPNIKVPALVIAGESSVLAPMDVFESWQRSIPDSKLVVIPCKAYHLAAVRPGECISALFDFLG